MKRFSRQREAIRQALCGVKTHPTAKEIYDCVRTEFPDISLATVYRNLAEFSRDGGAQMLASGDGNTHFDADTSSHCHFCCDKCGRITDVDADAACIDRLAKESGLVVTRHSMMLYGVCPQCLDKD